MKETLFAKSFKAGFVGNANGATEKPAPISCRRKTPNKTGLVGLLILVSVALVIKS